MASEGCSLIWVVFFLCVLGFSAKAIARNLGGAPELYAASDEKGLGRRLLQRPPCQQGTAACEVTQSHPNGHDPDPDGGRGHNYRP